MHQRGKLSHVVVLSTILRRQGLRESQKTVVRLIFPPPFFLKTDKFEKSGLPIDWCEDCGGGQLPQSAAETDGIRRIYICGLYLRHVSVFEDRDNDERADGRPTRCTLFGFEHEARLASRNTVRVVSIAG